MTVCLDSPARGSLASLRDLFYPARRSLLSSTKRHGPAWRPSTAAFIHKFLPVALLVIGSLAWTRIVLVPAANPHEEWTPHRWGLPWFPSWNTWAAAALQKKLDIAKRHAAEGHSGSSSSSATTTPLQSASLRASKQHSVLRLKYPVLWAAPFFSRSGYGTEAISYVVGLLENGLIAPEDLWITQAGDGYHPEAVNGLEPSIRDMLFAQEWRNITRRLDPKDRDRPVIVVCHVFPDCWRSAADDRTSQWMIIRSLYWLWDNARIRLFGLSNRNINGCPCPNDYIKDRVVYRVGRSMFETEKLPAPLVAFSKDLDDLLVPSQFSVDSFASSGVPMKKLHILPQGINTTLFDVNKRTPIRLGNLKGMQVTGRARKYKEHEEDNVDNLDGLLPDYENPDKKSAPPEEEKEIIQDFEEVNDGEKPGDPFRFLSVFKWETRKGWDILLSGYFQEFRAEENVELHVVTHAFGEKVDDFRKVIRDAVKHLMNVTSDDVLDKEYPRVYVYDKYIPDSSYPGLYNAMDALVVPTHGEGWGRPQFEAMAMGKPVISTNWSGLTEFMDETVSYPIKVEDIVDITDKDCFEWFKGQRWAQPSIDHMRKLMRDVLIDREMASAKGKAAARRIRTEYSIPAVARKALTEILRLQESVDHLLGDDVSLPRATVNVASSITVYP